MSATDQMVANNAAYAAGLGALRPSPAALAAPPSLKVAVLVCMDARVDPVKVFGLQEGEAHVLRNAGGVASEDVVRSLVISQHLLGTEEIVLLHHTDCGMEKFTEDNLKDEVQASTGVRPDFCMETFSDVDEDVRQTAARIKASPLIPHKNVRGFVYEVTTGVAREVSLG